MAITVMSPIRDWQADCMMASPLTMFVRFFYAPMCRPGFIWRAAGTARKYVFNNRTYNVLLLQTTPLVKPRTRGKTRTRLGLTEDGNFASEVTFWRRYRQSGLIVQKLLSSLSPASTLHGRRASRRQNRPYACRSHRCRTGASSNCLWRDGLPRRRAGEEDGESDGARAAREQREALRCPGRKA